ncbi:MAG TPA: ATP-binding protein [Hyphomonadaceae bacterium]|jgi:signal transduction histidine kinase/ActR/RegA family two-component response regulator|nr:ATP-binding protein [Hyphomonadaceae bacterium]
MYSIGTETAPALASLAETLAGVGYWRLDSATQRITWSANMFRIFGFEPGDPPSLTDAMSRVHPDERATANGNLENSQAGFSGESELVRLQLPTGELRYIQGRREVLKDASGAVIAVVGAVIDVTKHKLAQDELLQAKEKAEQAVAARNEFVANVTHELRTPLTAIIGYANLIGEGRGSDMARRLKLMQGAGRTLLSIVNNVLDFSRIEEGRALITPQAASPSDIARECLDLFRLMAGERGLDLRFDAASVPDFAMIDPDAVRQVLVNLVGNAVKFTEKGSISLSLAQEGSWLRITVADTGVGMTQGEIARLFQRYTPGREGRMGDAALRGAGLGLSICKSLVEAMGGEISASSTPGAGTRFSCTIPAPAAAAPISEAESGGLDGARVLIADDNPSIREIVRCLLEAAGAHVTEANDGLSAVALASSERFDALLIDLNMPGISGKEVVRFLRSLGLNRDAPIHAFTASGSYSVAEAREQGFDGLLTKPLDPRRLIELVYAAKQAKAA